jgi:hypothetical protein
MRKLLLIAIGTLAIVGSAAAIDLSSISCPPGGTAGPRTDEYMIDDGTGENSIGLTAGGTIIWLNQFQVMAGAEDISAIGVAWGQVGAGRASTLLIFSDPNNDGDPSDVNVGDLLFSLPVTSEGTNTDTFYSYPVPSVNVGVDGDFFFVGVCGSQNAGEYPARIDQTFPLGQSWVGGDGAISGFDCTNPNTGSLGVLFRIDDAGLPGNWMVRASAGLPSPTQNATWGQLKSMYK